MPRMGAMACVSRCGPCTWNQDHGLLTRAVANSLGLKGPNLERLYSAYESQCLCPASRWTGATEG